MKLRAKDKIKVVMGKDKGREAVVERVYPNQDKILAAGINIYKKHIKKSEKVPQGGLVELPRPISVSKLVLICPKCAKPTRIGYKLNQEKKIRICKKCKKEI